MKRFRGGLVFKTHRLVYHSTPGSRVIIKKKVTLPEKTEEGMSRVVFVSIDHFPKICGPPEYHLRSIKRLKQKVTLPEKTVEGMSRVVLPYPSPPSGDMKNLPRAPSMFKNNYFAEM